MHPDDPRLAHWEQRYATQDYVFGTEPNAFLRACHPYLQAGDHALAVADGEGRNGVWLAQQGLHVVSVEASRNAILKARQLAANANVAVDFVQANLLDWPWPEQAFDVVAAIFIQFLTAAERTSVFNAMKQALKPGGILLLQGYTPKQFDYRTGGPSSIEQLYTRQMLQDLLTGMDILTLREHESEVTEGQGHRGMAALVDVVARRPQ